jgi:hypothetical protein
LATFLAAAAVVFLAGLMRGAVTGVRDWPNMPVEAARYFAQRAFPGIAWSLCFPAKVAAETGVSRDERSDTWTFAYSIHDPRFAGTDLRITISRHGGQGISTRGPFPPCPSGASE